MKAIIVGHPHPYCRLHGTDPRAAYTPACATDIRKTFAQHTQTHAPHRAGDDYDATERSAHLDFIGGFK